MDITTQKKLDELSNLIKQRDEIDLKIQKILNPQSVVALPSGFSFKNAVLAIVEGSPEGIATRDVVSRLQASHPALGLDRKRIASTLAYLKNKTRQIKLIGRGMYAPIREDDGDDEIRIEDISF